MTERLACVLLVDERGWLLLQEHDGEAPRGADRWGMVGGHVEEGEDFGDAAYRELREETGIRLEAGHLYLWRDEEFRYADASEPFRYHLYTGRVDDLSDTDIVVGEGRRIVFVEPNAAAGLPLTESAQHFLPAYLASGTYRRLAGYAHPSRERLRFSSVVLVDRRGWVLLQERDEHPAIDPEKWGFVGGHVEPEEEYAEAAHRELTEETGVTVDDLRLVGVYDVFHEHSQSVDEFSLWTAAVDLTDADIVVGEGRQIVFVDPATIPDLPLTAACRVALRSFVESDLYQELVT